ncbi:MAG: glycosyl hydrolase 53 family protein [Lachnospiraceae bacterium]|nr:glycosyl hydrolase 53 family protein [Lachnospiraceae bacterium]
MIFYGTSPGTGEVLSVLSRKTQTVFAEEEGILEKIGQFIKGMDVSTLLEEEMCGARFYDHGKEGDLLEILKRYGVNYVRLRLWNDPYAADGTPYGAGTNDLGTTIALTKRALELDMGFLLDLHYSDFWADPGKQTIPKAWQGLSAEALKTAVYEYTEAVMERLKAEGASPTMVQVGNEITNGLLWPYGKKTGETEGFDRIAGYISAGIRGVRAANPEVPIMLHLDNGGNNAMYVEWFENYMRRGEDFDIIGFSYYPFWHGTLEQLEYNMRDMAKRYGKELIVAEVSMGFSMKDYREYEGISPDQLKGMATKPELVEKLEYPMSPKGQSAFMQDILQRIVSVPGGKGFFYWEPGWIPVPGCGWANEAALAYTGETGLGGNEWANQALFDYDGNALPALSVIRDFSAV